MHDNPDRALLERLACAGALPAPFDTNPLAADLHARIEAVDRDAGRVSIAFEPGARYLQGTGVVQGGIVAAVLDFGLAMAALSRLPAGRSVATLSLTTNYLRAASAGRLQVHAQVERIGRTAAFCSARCVQADGGAREAVVATATSALAVIALDAR